MDLDQEFERQIRNLLQKGYPQAAGLDENKFLKLINPLRDKIQNIPAENIDIENGHLPFVIVVKSSLVPTTIAMSKVDKDGKEGIVKLFPHVPEAFAVIEGIDIPEFPIYLLAGIDRGKKTLNIRPYDAMKFIIEAKRSPITIDEGVAMVTQFPEFLRKNNCFSLLASRHTGDRRVPAIWINAGKNPNLGWCWDGNPHTWLGSASCKNRLA